MRKTESKALPIIFSKGVKREERFFYPTIFNLLPSPKFLHYHDVLELGVCLRGSGICITPDGSTPFHVGDVQVFLPDQPHYNVASEEGSLWSFIDVDPNRIRSPHVSVDTGVLLETAKNAAKGGIFKESEHPTVVALVKSIAALVRSEQATESPTVDLIVSELCALLLLLSCRSEAPLPRSDNKKREAILPAIRAASEAVERGDHITPPDMASACYMSESHFRRLFTSVMGESPKTYLLRLQTRQASVLLVTTELSVSEIARRCGFEDNSTLYRRFTKAFGCSPSEYRQVPRKA